MAVGCECLCVCVCTRVCICVCMTESCTVSPSRFRASWGQKAEGQTSSASAGGSIIKGFLKPPGPPGPLLAPAMSLERKIAIFVSDREKKTYKLP